MKKGFWFALVLAVALALGYGALSPYLAVYRITLAAQAEDPQPLTQLVDFPALRQNIKSQMKEAAPPENNEEGPLFRRFALGLGNMMVDELLTPGGIARFFAVKRAFSDEETLSTSKARRRARELAQKSYISWKNPSLVDVRMEMDSDKEVRFWLGRDGFSWRLVNIALPLRPQKKSQ